MNQAQLAKQIRTGQHVPDILDCLAQLSNDEVPTPPELARSMLDLLPDHVWSQADYRWLDPCCKSGVFLRETAARLLDGLSDQIPNFAERRDHIYRTMLHGTAITEMTAFISRRTLYYSRHANGDRSVVTLHHEPGNLPFVRAEHTFPKKKDGTINGGCTLCGAPLELERGEGRENYAYSFIHGAYPTKEMADMKFDVIVGNPPFQIGMTDAQGKKTTNILPLYQRFVQKAIEMDPRYLVMITPSRWFTGGKGLGAYREQMIADRRLRVLVDNPKVFDCFPGVEIMGGVSYFLWDRDHADDCEVTTRIDGEVISTMTRDLREGDGVLVRDNRAASIIDKAREGASSARTLADVVGTRDPFGQQITTNYSHAAGDPFEGSVPLVYGNTVGYVRPAQLQRHHNWVDKWKVLLSMGYNGGQQVDEDGNVKMRVLGEPIALAPGAACTQTYLVAGVFDSPEETENYAHYLATKFARFLVLQRKSTQHVTADRFRFVPMLDMTRRWSDKDLYEHFGLSDDEIKTIEQSIQPRSVNLSLDSPVPATHLPGGSKYQSGDDAGDVDEDDDD